MSPDAAWAARLAWELAPQTCPPTCRGYHRLWPTLRLLGLGAGPDRHHDLFARAIEGSLERTAAPRLLVSGTADHAMVQLALELAGERTTLTALDRCPTPLAIVDAYAAAVGASHRVHTVAADALAPPGPGSLHLASFDLILTHSFLSQVTSDQRRVLLQRWHDALRPGGVVATNTRLATSSHEAFDHDRAQALEHSVRHRVEEVDPVLLPAPAHQLLAEVGGYAAAVAIHPVTDPDELVAAVTGAGLVLERFERVTTAGGALPGAGPGTAQPATYLELVAVRP